MAKHPKVMEKAQAEARQVFANVDEAGLHKLDYLQLLIKETLNIPPIPLLFPRESKEACKITGYDMPAQSKVTVNIWRIGREPINWTEPERYSIQRDFLIVQWIIRGLILNSSHLVLEYCLVWLRTVVLPLAQLLCFLDWIPPNGLRSADLVTSQVFGSS